MGEFKNIIQRQRERIEREKEKLARIKQQAPSTPSQIGLRNFFNTDDPLNYVPISTLHRNKWESDEQYDSRLQKARNESIQQSEQKLSQNEKELDKAQRIANTNYANNLIDNVKQNKNTQTAYEAYEREAINNLAQEKKLLEAKFNDDGSYTEVRSNKDLENPFLYDINQQEERQDLADWRLYQEKGTQLRDLYSSIFDSEYEDEDFFKKHPEQEKILQNDAFYQADYQNWNNLSAKDKESILLTSFIENNFMGELVRLVEKFPELNDLYMSDNPQDIRTVAALILKEFQGVSTIKKAESDEILDKIAGDDTFLGKLGKAFDYLKTKGTENIEEGLNQKFSPIGMWNMMGDLWSGAAAWALGTVGTISTNLTKNGLGWAYQGINLNAGEKDAEIDEKVSNFFKKRVEPEYNKLLHSNTPEDKKRKQYLENLFYEASVDKNLGSVAFRANEGTYLTELSDEEALLLALEYEAWTEMAGVQLAQQQVRDFWQDRVATRQSWSDAASNTVGQFVTTGVADIASAAAIFGNAFQWGTYKEGFVDNLVRNNTLMRWANDVMETGCFDEEERAKYKDLKTNKYSALRTREEENSIFTWDDLQDAIGQYGFTVGSTIVSMGGSLALKGASKVITKSAMASSKSANWLGRAFTYVNADWLSVDGKARQIYRNLLKSGQAARNTTEGLELLNRLKATGLYRGNLIIDGAIGTAEGGLEAIGTYDTFKEEMTQKYLGQMQEEIDAAMAAIQATPEGGDNDARIQSKIDEIQAKYSDILNYIEENAADAAALNFISNSAINGFLQVGMKELTLSKEGRLAARQYLGKNKKLNDYIKFTATEGGGLIAEVKDEFLKKGGFWNMGLKTLKKAVENIGGEFLEEFSQGVSDAVSRAMMEDDVRHYINTVYEGGGIDAYTMDLGSMVKQGLNVLVDNAQSRETLYSGYMGALSSMIGGVNVLGGVMKARHRLTQYLNDVTIGRLSDEGFLTKAKEFAKMSKDVATGFVQNAFTESYRDVRNEKETAQALADSINEWFHNSDNKELLTHMGGALGFKRSLEKHLADGNLFGANNDKLGLAIENAFMMEVLAETEQGRAYIASMYNNANLMDRAQFDENGKLVTDINAVSPEQIEMARKELQEQQDAKLKPGEKSTPVSQQEVLKLVQDKITAAQALITTFRNKEGQKTRDLNMSDQEIAQRISKNISEFSEIRQDIAKARRQLAWVMHDDNMDPMTEQVLVYAMLTQQDAKNRHRNLKERLKNAMNSENLSDEQKEALDKKTDASPQALDLIVRYGTIKKAQEAYEQLTTQANTAAENSRDKKNDAKERQKYKQQAAVLEGKKSRLKAQLDAVLKNLDDEQKQNLDKIQFMEGDMLGMSDEQIATVLNNKKAYSKEQQLIIDNFIKIAQSGINSIEKNDINLTAEEVENDFKDLIKLKTKAQLYDNHLKDLLENKDGISKEVSTARNKKREDILAYLYQDDLKLKEGETYRDLVERLDEKVNNLQELGKLQDAEILKRLINRDPVVSSIRRNFNILHRMMFDTFYSARNDPNYYKGICGLRTLVDQGISIDLIKKWFSSGEYIDKIKDALRRKTNLLAEGGYLLNYFIQKDGKEPINVENETELTSVIAAMNKLVNMAVAVEKQRERTPQPGTTDDPSKGTRGNDDPNKLSPSSKDESESFEISSLADLDPSSKKFEKLNEEYALNDNLKSFSPKQAQENGKKTRLVVRNIPEIGPIILVVVQTNNSQDLGAFSGTIEGETYYFQAIGFIDLNGTNKSKVLEDQLKKVPNDNDTIVLDEINIELKEPKPVNPELNLEDGKNYPTLKSQLDKDSDDQQRAKHKEQVANIILNGRWLPTQDGAAFLDQYGRPVVLDIPDPNNPEEHSTLNAFWELPATGSTDGKTVEQLFSTIKDDTDDSLDELTDILSKSLFFRTIYEFWNKVVPNINNKDARQYAFKNYIGNFLYLGKNLDAKLNAAGNKFIIKSPVQGEPDIEIDFPITSSPKDRAVAVTKMLYTIWKTQSQGVQTLRNVRPEIPSCSPRTQEQVRNILKHSIEDLIELGVLRGNAGNVVRRNATARNPYYSIKKSDKSDHPTNADDGDPIDPENPPTPPVKIDMGAEAIKNRIEQGKRIVEKLIAKAKEYILPDKDAAFYQNGEKKSARVTTVEYSTTQGDVQKPEFNDQQKTKGKIASAHGTFVDTVVRNFFEIMYSDRLPDNWNSMSNQQKAEWLLNAIKQSKDFEDEGGHHSFPLGYEEQVQMPEFIANLMAVKQLMDDNGWTVFPKDIKAFGQLAVAGSTNEALNVAGTLDLLVMDDKGIFHIIDMKTKFGDAYYGNGIELSKAAWEIQVASYQQLLQQQYPDMVFGENYILPIQVTYTEPVIESSQIFVSRNGMDVASKYGPVGRANGIPQFQVEFNGQDDVKLEDLLIQLNGIDHPIKLDREKLTQEQIDALVPMSQEPTVPPVNPPKNEVTDDDFPPPPNFKKEEQTPQQDETPEAQPASEDSKKYDDKIDDQGWESERSGSAARFTDFMNKRIMPLTSIRVSTIQRVAHRLKKTLIGRRGFRILITKDLANTFCFGSIEQLKSIVGNAPHTNMRNVVSKLRQHFREQLSKKDDMIKAVINNHVISLALKQLMEGTINEDTFLDTLTERGIQAHLVDAYIGWKSTDNKQEYAKNVLANLEVSKDYSEEVYSQQLASIQEVYDDMSAKLQFLEDGNAVQLLNVRAYSVEKAVMEGNLEEEKIIPNSTIEKLRQSKKGETFGALKLLEDIIATTQNNQMKALAEVLLRKLRYSSQGILVTTDPYLLPAVEGMTDGRSISLNPKILSSYHTTERVLLHEIIHCVVKDSPELEPTVEQLRKDAIKALAQATGKIQQEIQESEYGFKNNDEFIAEFFTNYAFQARLKNLSLDDQSGKSIFNRILDAIINFFKGASRNKSLFDKIESTMEEILQAENLPGISKTKENIKVITGKEQFEDLPQEIQDEIKAKGGSAKQFNSLSKAEQDYILRCCSF